MLCVTLTEMDDFDILGPGQKHLGQAQDAVSQCQFNHAIEMQRGTVVHLNVGIGLRRRYDLGVLLCVTVTCICDFDILLMAKNT